MKKWTDEEREEAADACAMMASSDASYMMAPCMDLDDVLAADSAAHALAVMSYRELRWPPWNWFRARWAEAEARLRCGWLPGDEP